jgi:two-component system response regulator
MSQTTPAVVLLVEDDPDHAELVARALEEHRQPVRLVHVWNGRSALQYLMREGRWSTPEASPSPDLVLLDLRLPGMNGGEVLRRIKSSSDFRRIPVVLLSTSEVRGEIPAAEGAQADHCTVKPVDGERFRGLVRDLVSEWAGRDAESSAVAGDRA